jgi:hypothetical protein
MKTFFTKLQQQLGPKKLGIFLEMAYNERGSNTNKHQDKSQSIAVINGEVVEELAEEEEK